MPSVEENKKLEKERIKLQNEIGQHNERIAKLRKESQAVQAEVKNVKRELTGKKEEFGVVLKDHEKQLESINGEILQAKTRLEEVKGLIKDEEKKVGELTKSFNKQKDVELEKISAEKGILSDLDEKLSERMLSLDKKEADISARLNDLKAEETKFATIKAEIQKDLKRVKDAEHVSAATLEHLKKYERRLLEDNAMNKNILNMAKEKEVANIKSAEILRKKEVSLNRMASELMKIKDKTDTIEDSIDKQKVEVVVNKRKNEVLEQELQERKKQLDNREVKINEREKLFKSKIGG